jgi:putative acetyltransferase
MAIIVRPEVPTDDEGIHAVVTAAFGGSHEADLVDQLRANGDGVVSLVAMDGNVLVGHVLFSRMQAPFEALGLAPVSVIPARQRTGIGALLIKTGLAKARSQGWRGVFVLGEPAYYSRFGFSVRDAEGFSSPYAGPYFMVMGLSGPLPVTTGAVAYAPAFAKLS